MDLVKFMQFKKKPQSTDENIRNLKNEFYEIIEQLNNTDRTFDLVSDPKLIEACIYERKALSLRAERLLKLAASYDLSLDALCGFGKKDCNCF
ncbi:MAG: hypothetical protein J5874_01610 [Oscillospiraceae bacterium]|nr:hypothetical protein [Oscillospiraceae bacterium]